MRWDNFFQGILDKSLLWSILAIMMSLRAKLKHKIRTVSKTLFWCCTLVLCLSLFSAPIFASVFYDGQCLQRCCCGHRNEISGHTSAHTPPPCCSGNTDPCCHLSKHQAPDSRDAVFPAMTNEDQSSNEALAMAVDSFADQPFSKEEREAFYLEPVARSVPIYLQHLTLLF